MKKVIMAGMFLFVLCSIVYAETVVEDHLLISTSNQLYEYTIQGNYVQSIATEYPDGYPGTEHARDIVMDADGNVCVYNGTFYPYMSTYMPESASWSHMTCEGFSTVNGVTYGGIGVYDQTVFATDMFTGNGGEAQGVMAFDAMTGQAQRFAEDVQPIDLSIGRNGLLYTLSPGGSPCGRTVHVYDPVNLNLLDTIDLTAIFGWTEHRALAVDENGDIYIADLDGQVHHITANGELVATITPECDWVGSPINCEFSDINISADGEIALGTRFGEVLVTDTDFSDVFKFRVGTAVTFVAFSTGVLVANTPPVISIETPCDGESFFEDDIITFTASASDEEDGDLGPSVQWISSLQGAIGTGAMVSAQLIAGQHTITAAVSDSQAEEAVAEVTVSVTSSGMEEYCDASGIYTYYEYIDSITVGTTVFESGDNGGYIEHIGATPVVLGRGEAAAIKLTPGFPYASYVEYWRIWIDLNQDKILDSDELLYSGSANTDINTAITIPSTAIAGTTRMRVAMRYGGPAESCGTFYYGEVEDIHIVIEE